MTLEELVNSFMERPDIRTLADKVRKSLHTGSDEHYQLLRRTNFLALFASYCFNRRRVTKYSETFTFRYPSDKPVLFDVFVPKNYHRKELSRKIQVAYKDFISGPSWLSCRKMRQLNLMQPCVEIAKDTCKRDFFCLALHETGHILFHLDNLFEGRMQFVRDGKPVPGGPAESVQEAAVKHYNNRDK